MKVSSAAFLCRSSPSLRLIWDSDRGQPDGYCNLYTADPDSQGFTVYEEEDCGYLLQRLAVLGCIGKDGEPLAPLPVAVAEKIFDVVRLPKRDFDFHQALLYAIEMSQITDYDLFQRYGILESAGELFLVLKEQHRFKVFRINTDRIVLEPVESIGSRAFFLGRGRYMSVDAHKFPYIDANCIYYVKSTFPTCDIYKYDLEVEKEERVSQARHSLNPSTSTLPATIPPFTILRLLSSYTNSIQTSQLTRCARIQSVTRSGFKSEYAYEASDPGSCWCLNMIEVVDFQNYPRRPRNGTEVARP
ncbi:hypothetical protein CFC21_044814 [Triticum aestivum]|uniref:KIB1-4 beta-propeller domain-containing protein n=3 Tax=Triticum TaxID=4564 RepID=A0A9R1JXZ5_WHEAT|nr:hypothetical protein CFC21_044814 [Triticum aestivum]CDM86984.1 unnamed protein product [Triticum aestivum]VAH86117.1 unnamed protein product [Triticum turgidum subsp. durum]